MLRPSLSLQANSDSHHRKRDCVARGTGARWVANSQLQQISPLGALRAQYVSACTGDPLNYNQITHECRVDATSARGDVLTTRMKGKLLPDTDVRDFFKPDLGTLRTKADTFYGSEIVRWNREANVVEPLYDLFDFASPEKDMFAFAWNAVDASCSGNATRAGVEYHHVSSVSVGSDANYIVASRELSTIWSLAHDGSGVQWTLSSELASSDYSFEHARDAFYQPHDVLQLPNGHLLVVDDGLNRPGCTEQVTANCFSRAIVYRLDWETRAVSVVWQFEFPLELHAASWTEASWTAASRAS